MGNSHSYDPPYFFPDVLGGEYNGYAHHAEKSAAASRREEHAMYKFDQILAQWKESRRDVHSFRTVLGHCCKKMKGANGSNVLLSLHRSLVKLILDNLEHTQKSMELLQPNCHLTSACWVCILSLKCVQSLPPYLFACPAW